MKQINQVVGYLRSLCKNSHWPRGELNLPRALVTEKAYPENEVVIIFRCECTGDARKHDAYHPRTALRSEEPDRSGRASSFADENHTWYGGIGDITLGLKREIFSSLKAGSILSLQGSVLLPTGIKRADSEAARPRSRLSLRSINCSAPTPSCKPNSARTCRGIPILRRNHRSSIPRSDRVSRQITGWDDCGRRWWSFSPPAIL